MSPRNSSASPHAFGRPQERVYEASASSERDVVSSNRPLLNRALDLKRPPPPPPGLPPSLALRAGDHHLTADAKSGTYTIDPSSQSPLKSSKQLSSSMPAPTPSDNRRPVHPPIHPAAEERKTGHQVMPRTVPLAPPGVLPPKTPPRPVPLAPPGVLPPKTPPHPVPLAPPGVLPPKTPPPRHIAVPGAASNKTESSP